MTPEAGLAFSRVKHRVALAALGALPRGDYRVTLRAGGTRQVLVARRL